jgi:glutathione S-transferase
MEEARLYYWNFRGLKEPIVQLLEYCKVPYKFIPLQSGEEWTKVRNTAISKGFKFASLPLLEHEGKYISEPLAIMTHIALSVGQAEMVPNDSNFVQFLEMYGVVSDLFSEITSPAYSCTDSGQFREAYLRACQSNKQKIESIDKIVGKSKWILGPNLSILDFKLVEVLAKMKAIEEDMEVDIIDQYMHLETYLGRFLGLPAIKQYRVSDRFVERPFNGDACWK